MAIEDAQRRARNCDRTLRADLVHPVGERRAQVCRVISAVTCDLSVPLTVRAIAKATKLSEGFVRDVMSNDPLYADLMDQAARQVAGSMMARGLHKMDELVQNSEKPEVKMRAFEQITKAYKTLVMTRPRQESDGAVQDIEKLFKKIDERNIHTAGKVRRLSVEAAT